jgi:hypothetical protein
MNSQWGTGDVGKSLRQGVRNDPKWWLGLVTAFAVMLLVNPSGFVGGGQDDLHYLQAARCIREYGWCLPHDHWSARWPVVGPIALFTTIFGESRFAVSIAPAIASFLALALLAIIGNKTFARPVGWIGALLLLLTPAFAVQLSQPAVEATELCFIFAGFLCVLKWRESPGILWAVLAGVLFGLAVQVRETALVAAPFAFIYLCAGKPKPRLPDVAMAALGFALPFLAEFAWFAASTGDPFYRIKLSIAHTQIWSSELLGPIDRTRPPFFNKAYIANWRLEPGIHIYWAVDGLLNLFVNGLAGLSLPFVTLFVLFGRKKLGPDTTRRSLTLLLMAVAYMACLIYAFAIDPKARIMLVALSMTSMALALITLRLRAIGYPLVAYSTWIAAAILGLTLQYGHQRTDLIESAAIEWIAQRPGQIEIDSATHKYLALVPAAQRLPGLEANKPYVLFTGGMPCEEWIAKSGFPPRSLTVVEAQKNTRISLPGLGGEMCLLRYNRVIPADVLREHIRKVVLEERLRGRGGYAPRGEATPNRGIAGQEAPEQTTVK